MKNVLCIYCMDILEEKSDGPNIVEAYVQLNGRIIIIIIGMIGSKRTYISKSLLNALNIKETIDFKIINLNDYLIKDKIEVITIDDINYDVHDHPNCYDYDKLNNDVNNNTRSIIIYGGYIDFEKITFKCEFNYFVNTSISIINDHYNNDNSLNNYIKKYYVPLYADLITNKHFNSVFYINNRKTNIEKLIDKIFLRICKDISDNLP